VVDVPLFPTADDFSTVTGRRARDSVPALKSDAEPDVATEASPVTCDDAIEAAVVSTPLVVVTTIWPVVEPMAPAFVMLPWVWVAGVLVSLNLASSPRQAEVLLDP
jgi:hypothetical protein